MRLAEKGRFYVPDDILIDGSVIINTAVTMDAVDEGIQLVGQVVLDDAAEGTKIFSSSGSKLFWHAAGSNVFTNGGTQVRVGVQSIDTSGATIIGNGVFDVYRELTGGVDVITNSSMMETVMDAGSRTISHGEFVSVAWSMTARGGSDSVKVAGMSDSFVTATSRTVPITYTKTDASWNRASTAFPLCYLQFDDGSLGWINGQYIYGAAFNGNTTTGYNIDTATADEYGNLFVLDEFVRVTGFFGSVYVDPNANFEINIYRDPLGSPELIHTHAVDNKYIVKSNTQYAEILFGVVIDLAPGTYALTLRPTTTSNIRVTFSRRISNALWRAAMAGATPAYAVRRLDNSGAFSTWQGTDIMYPFYLACSHRGQMVRSATIQLGV